MPCSRLHLRNKWHSNIFPLPYNSEITKLTSPQVAEIEISWDTFSGHWCPYQLLKVSYGSLKNYSHGAITNSSGGRVNEPALIKTNCSFSFLFFNGHLCERTLNHEHIMYKLWGWYLEQRLSYGIFNARKVASHAIQRDFCSFVSYFPLFGLFRMYFMVILCALYGDLT